eukprot:6186510-Pleurochrysis_carterae.AAC.2
MSLKVNTNASEWEAEMPAWQHEGRARTTRSINVQNSSQSKRRLFRRVQGYYSCRRPSAPKRDKNLAVHLIDWLQLCAGTSFRNHRAAGSCFIEFKRHAELIWGDATGKPERVRVNTIPMFETLLIPGSWVA